MSDDFQPSEEAMRRPFQWAVERMNWEAEHIKAKPSLTIQAPKPASWLRAFRRVRLTVHELAMVIVNLSAAAVCVGIAWAVWKAILTVVERAAK